MSARGLIGSVAAIAVAVAVAAGAATAPALAGLYAAGASIASASLQRLEQGDDATVFTTISQDARFVVMDTRATNFYADDDPDPPGATRRGGIFRRDLASGALEKVADGDLVDDADGTLLRRGAHGPAVSADGRFVAFSTAQRLVPADANDNIDVYRRDMTLSAGTPGAYVLVSARDGADAGASYAARPLPLPGRNPGSDVFPGHAISADGDRVVFRTVELASDLPDHAAVDVPGGQVLVRDVSTRRTRLLTRRTVDGGPAGGALGPVVVSADGSTVAWVGSEAPAQARFLAGEQLDPTTNFYLYRRLDDPAERTRRITGVADPDDPTCEGSPVGSDPTATGSCYGPLADTEQGRGDISQRAPALSGDGLTVAFLAAAAGRPTNVNNPGLDLFVTDMRPGVSRKAGTRELTREGDPNDLLASAPIESVSMAADGIHLAVTTSRARFVLPTLAPLGTAFRRQPDAREIYLVDLPAGTIERAVRGVGDADATGDAGTDPSLSADGSTLAFTSAAGNLFFGDANEKVDAFWVSRQPDAVTRVPPPAAPRPLLAFEGVAEDTGPRLRVTTRHRRDGALVLTIIAPGAGRVLTFARAGSPLRTVARANRTTSRTGRATAVLKPSGRDLRRLRDRRRLAATVRVRFAPKDTTARALSRVVRTRFTYVPPKKDKARTSGENR